MKQNKKIIKILFANFLLIFLFLFLLNIMVEEMYEKRSINFIENIQRKLISEFINKSDIKIDEAKYETEEYNVKVIESNENNSNLFCKQDHFLNGFENNYTKNPIIVLGCSYAYGHGLKKEQTFPYLLSKITKRPVFNFAECGGDILSSYNDLAGYISDSIGGGGGREGI